jgi:hypothetical protein
MIATSRTGTAWLHVYRMVMEHAVLQVQNLGKPNDKHIAS